MHVNYGPESATVLLGMVLCILPPELLLELRLHVAKWASRVLSRVRTQVAVVFAVAILFNYMKNKNYFLYKLNVKY